MTDARRMSRAKKDNLWGWLFACSPLIGFALFGMIPLLFSLFLSFGKLQSFDITDVKFVGFENYVRLFTQDAKFIKSIGNTFIYAVFTVVLSLAVSLFLAVQLNKKIKFKKAFRLILFIPFVCSVVATSTMWKWIFDYNYGILNDVVTVFGIPRQNWLGNASTAMPVIIFMSVWSGAGYNIILYTAALSAINKSYYEAAMLDGANRVKIFFKVTLPLISPTTFFLAVTGLIGALQSFANFQIMTPTGGPEGSTLTMVFRVYQVAFQEDARVYGMGYAAAMSWIEGVIIMIFTAINFTISKKWVHYD